MKRLLCSVAFGLVALGISGIAQAVPATGNMDKAISTVTDENKEPKADTKTKKEKKAGKKQRKGAKHGQATSAKKGKTVQ
ncbi:hypothetical protein [Geomesophilobacter sediminis]|uniref:Pentapeptide MXKDX repeat protein n=1 Tax=Geomesophilobacter sediminis TaxID=2798584 RepID=A0A8J7M2Q3_9BACT|nr:hypothetical protein [Geomesophilobacter sediminis]MBJ6727218.1 hypothetical protein [Geomesophilobacter sediminis]